MTAGARPGQTISRGEGYRWVAYSYEPGEMCAAVYVGGKLLRRDLEGWWVAGYLGNRFAVSGDPVARLSATVPAGWELHPEQEELTDRFALGSTEAPLHRSHLRLIRGGAAA